MVRQRPKIDPRLEVLMDERDHLQIQLSMALDADRPDRAFLKDAAERMAVLDRHIGSLQRKYHD